MANEFAERLRREVDENNINVRVIIQTGDHPGIEAVSLARQC